MSSQQQQQQHYHQNVDGGSSTYEGDRESNNNLQQQLNYNGNDDDDGIIQDHAKYTYRQIRSCGQPTRPLDFPPPKVMAGVRVNALVVHPDSGSRQVCSGVIHREDINMNQQDDETIYDNVDPSMDIDRQVEQDGYCRTTSAPPASTKSKVYAYWPQRRLQDALYGSVWACLLLQRHYGVAADDAARAAGVEPGSDDAPIVWEITSRHVAIKMVEWAKVHHMRGRLLEDPVKEVAAMQLLDQHVNVLPSTEVLQDTDFLYSVMPFCRDGDLFGIVVEYANENGGDIGMPESVARYWFRQILWGLHHLQSKGVCHRDLSLENILVDGDTCMIIDMGMCLRVPYNDPTNAGMVTDVTRCGVQQQRRLMKPQGVCGKHNYMSPEVVANAEPFDGFAIDLWAAAVVLYIMLTGFPPYDQASRTDQRFDLIVKGRLVEQLKLWDIHLSKDGGDLLQRMMQYHAKERLSLAQVMNHPWVTSTDVTYPNKSNAAAALPFSR